MLDQISVLQHQTAYKYIRSIVNVRTHGKDIDRTEFVTFVRNNENILNVVELEEGKKKFVITDLSKVKVIEKFFQLILMKL